MRHTSTAHGMGSGRAPATAQNVANVRQVCCRRPINVLKQYIFQQQKKHFEKYFQNLNGVVKTQVGYSGGHYENPTYENVCSGITGHAEVVYLEFK